MASTNQSTGNVTVVNQTAISESLDRLCNQSVTNIQVPRFDAYPDVHDFMAEYERLTSNLTEEQKLLILPKSFPVNCHRSWYGTELSPLIEEKASWSEVKKKILERFSSTDAQEKHFSRLRELKYEPDGNQSLLSYIEDILYSYQRAYPNDATGGALKYVKSSMPPSLKAKLNLHSEFKNATSIEMLKSAAKDYDLAKDLTQKSSIDRESTQELANMIKELIINAKNESKAIRLEMAAAFKAQEERQSQALSQVNQPRSPGYNNGFDRQRSPFRGDNNYRQPSPSNNRYNGQYNRSRSPGRRDYYQRQSQYYQAPGNQLSAPANRRSPSPSNYKSGFSRDGFNRPPTPYQHENETKLSANNEIYNAKLYFEKFGKPPGPCPNCGGLHYARHCLIHLN